MPRLSRFFHLENFTVASVYARVFLRLVIMGIVSSVLIYLPNYLTLQVLTAELSAKALSSLGYSFVVNSRDPILLNSFEVTRECTGIEGIVLISVFLSLMPGFRKAKRVLAVISAGLITYLANVLRVILELAMFSSGILTWPIIHDDFGFAFSVISVVLILFLASRIVAPDGVQDLVKILLA